VSQQAISFKILSKYEVEEREREEEREGSKRFSCRPAIAQQTRKRTLHAAKAQ
jgi:hypothetical protein